MIDNQYQTKNTNPINIKLIEKYIIEYFEYCNKE